MKSFRRRRALQVALNKCLDAISVDDRLKIHMIVKGNRISLEHEIPLDLSLALNLQTAWVMHSIMDEIVYKTRGGELALRSFVHSWLFIARTIDISETKMKSILANAFTLAARETFDAIQNIEKGRT